MAKKRVFSGIQPSGNLHLGNYLGAIVNWVREQDKKDNIFCIVDLHAITVPKDSKNLQKSILETAKIYLASGIDPKKSTIFLQSQRPEHTELTWILNCFTYMGEMQRMTQFKEKGAQNQASVGLFDYPVLMASDILLYDTEEVPVGEDQKQHVEITRDIAERLNNKYGDIFTIPKAIIQKEGARIMSLTDPTSKMSKSDPNPNSRIELRDDPKTIEKKIMRAQTDSGKEIKYNPREKAGISNMLNILAVIKQKTVSDIEAEFRGKNYGEFKKQTAKEIIAFLKPIQDKLKEYDKNEDQVRKVLNEGSQSLKPIAQKNLQKVKEKVGLGLK